MFFSGVECDGHCLCRPFMIIEGCLDSNPECSRRKRARYQLNHPRVNLNGLKGTVTVNHPPPNRQKKLSIRLKYKTFLSIWIFLTSLCQCGIHRKKRIRIGTCLLLYQASSLSRMRRKFFNSGRLNCSHNISPGSFSCTPKQYPCHAPYRVLNIVEDTGVQLNHWSCIERKRRVPGKERF